MIKNNNTSVTKNSPPVYIFDKILAFKKKFEVNFCYFWRQQNDKNKRTSKPRELFLVDFVQLRERALVDVEVRKVRQEIVSD